MSPGAVLRPMLPESAEMMHGANSSAIRQLCMRGAYRSNGFTSSAVARGQYHQGIQTFRVYLSHVICLKNKVHDIIEK